MSHFTVGVILPTSIDLSAKPDATPATPVDDDVVLVVEPETKSEGSAVIDPTKSIIQVVDETIASLIADYYEGIEVPEYETECYCIGLKAQTEAREAADAQYGTIETLRGIFYARADIKALKRIEGKMYVRRGDPKPSKEELDAAAAAEAQVDVLWREYIKPWHDAQVAALEANPNKNAANPECETCKGTGKDTSTYNPKSKWDWYVIGGRWDGVITQQDENDEAGSDFALHFTDPATHPKPALSKLQRNAVKVADLLHRFEAGDDLQELFALVTPDGAWHEKGKMGWFAFVSDEKSEEAWHTERLDIFKQYGDHWLVLIDCHI